MGRKPERTVLTDDYGGEHEYYVQQHPGREAVTLFNALFGVAAPVFGSLAQIFGQDGVQNPLDLDIKELDFARLAVFDSAEFARALDLVSTLISETFTPEMYMSILKHTKRAMVARGERKDVNNIDQAQWKGLGEPYVFDDAFGGNIGELLSATFWVLKVNFAPLFIARLRRLGVDASHFQGLWSKISERLSAA